MQYICIYLLYSLNIIYIPYIIYKLINIYMKCKDFGGKVGNTAGSGQ